MNFNTDKELNYGDIFQSDIQIKKTQQGLAISSTVRTADEDRAYKVALLFIGQMLDILAMKTKLPLLLASTEYRKTGDTYSVKPIINEDEFRFCFDLARTLNLSEDKLLRAFSWYRKGLYTEDPFDRYLAFWNSISVLADGYCNDNERTRRGIINKIWDCFLTLWGNVENWEYITNDNWINESNEIRNKIAHGGVTVDIRYIDNVINELEVLQKVAYKFLFEWALRLGYNLNGN